MTLEEQTAIIRVSKLFDADFYCKQFRAFRIGDDPARHCAEYWQEYMADPSPLFDIGKYLAAYPQVMNFDIHPLCHYEIYGKYQNFRIWGHADSFDKNYIYDNLKIESSHLRFSNTKISRIAVFAYCDLDYEIKDYVINYLEELAQVTDFIVFISASYLPYCEIAKINHIISYFSCQKRIKNSNVSWCEGIRLLEKFGILSIAKELIICDNSSYAPILGFQKIFTSMEEQICDAWYLPSPNIDIITCAPSFMVFKSNTFQHPVFTNFFYRDFEAAEDSFYSDKIFSEISHKLRRANFRILSYGETSEMGIESDDKQERGIERENEFLYNPNRFPLLPRRFFISPFVENIFGTKQLLDNLAFYSKSLHNIILSDACKYVNFNINEIYFSVIMPTYNRGKLISGAIDAVLKQSFQNFELIIVDDGSIDNTLQILYDKYTDYIALGKIKILSYSPNRGVSHARNIGLQSTKYDWVCYADSDNNQRPYWLETYALAISNNPSRKAFYAKIKRVNSGTIVGREWNFEFLINQSNYIDLGVFAHHISLYKELGGFDENINGLVDYELITRYGERYEPFFINSILLDYNDGDHDRITNSHKYTQNINYLRHKRHVCDKIISIILPDEKNSFPEYALQSAMAQTGEFAHEIILLNAGDAFFGKHLPSHIKKMTPNQLQVHIRVCSARYIAFLHSDDIWLDPLKNSKQQTFLKMRPDIILNSCEPWNYGGIPGTGDELRTAGYPIKKVSYVPAYNNPISGDMVIIGLLRKYCSISFDKITHRLLKALAQHTNKYNFKEKNDKYI